MKNLIIYLLFLIFFSGCISENTTESHLFYDNNLLLKNGLPKEEVDSILNQFGFEGKLFHEGIVDVFYTSTNNTNLSNFEHICPPKGSTIFMGNEIIEFDKNKDEEFDPNIPVLARTIHGEYDSKMGIIIIKPVVEDVYIYSTNTNVLLFVEYKHNDNMDKYLNRYSFVTFEQKRETFFLLPRALEEKLDNLLNKAIHEFPDEIIEPISKTNQPRLLHSRRSEEEP